ncbi:pyridoxal phosphate-dependent decarboxylase family protein [Micrococcus lylae]|uniref:Aspartate aminotransferase family protein n=1 Tax=Micrococcus lylae TaxID=1273 RepID=A0ABY2K1N0_9MICC|nr:pyridoxal-dependent decarboxylase [Micrococcus lylae]TFI00905.1 aspartate aminotransferase family protein [Micrococcus lylae]
MTPEEFRTHGHALIDWIADYRSTLHERPVMSPLRPGVVAAQLSAAAPEAGEDPAAVLADLDRVVLPGLSLWQHPEFFHFFPANAELSSVLGDIASTGLGVLGLSWESSPALSEVEIRTMDWMRELLGLSEGWRGVVQDSASGCALTAMLEARERASGFAMHAGGTDQGRDRMVVYCTAQAHSSVPKAMLLAGFGRQNVREVPVDADYAMDAQALRAIVAEDRAAGLRPAAVVATCGTTATTALDPLAEIGRIAQDEDLWFHVDAAMAGSAMLLPECRWMWEGVELADSLVVNAHKWLGVAFDCSLFFVKDPVFLEKVMATHPSYLQSSHDEDVVNLRDWGVPLGRRFRALKLWFMLRMEGAEALRARLRRDLDNAAWLAAQVDAAEGWERVAPTPLQTVCVRHVPAGLDPADPADAEAIDAHTRASAQAVNASGKAAVSLATLEGRWMVRLSVGALGTEREHVERLWKVLGEAVAR